MPAFLHSKNYLKGSLPQFSSPGHKMKLSFTIFILSIEKATPFVYFKELDGLLSSVLRCFNEGCAWFADPQCTQKLGYQNCNVKVETQIPRFNLILLIWFMNQRALYNHALSITHRRHWRRPVSASVLTSPWHLVRHRNFIPGTYMHIYAHQIFNDSDL